MKEAAEIFRGFFCAVIRPFKHNRDNKVIVDKRFLSADDRIRASGVQLESLAIVESMNPETNEIEFR